MKGKGSPRDCNQSVGSLLLGLCGVGAPFPRTCQSPAKNHILQNAKDLVLAFEEVMDKSPRRIEALHRSRGGPPAKFRDDDTCEAQGKTTTISPSLNCEQQ